MPSRSSKNKLVDVRETRHAPSAAGKVELREDPRTGDLVLTGYASTFDEYEVYGGPENWGWIERMDKGAFNRTLSEKPDLQLLINHGGAPLARTKSGTLTLSIDDVGLRVEARLEKTDPDVQALVPKMMRGDLDEMSFAFRVLQQEWSAAPGYDDPEDKNFDPMSYRLITELSLQRGDVSVVNYGANPHTSAQLATVGQAVGLLAEADPGELRSAIAELDPVQVRAVQRVLAKAARADTDDDPLRLLAGLDATLDEACNLVANVDTSTLPPEVAQALDLLVAAESTVDELMEVMGVYDPDDDESGEANSARKAGRKAWLARQLARKRAGLSAGGGSGGRLHHIADNLRLEVGGDTANPVVTVKDATGLLDAGLATRLSAEVRAALLGERGQLNRSAPPAATQADQLSLTEGKYLTGETDRVAEVKARMGIRTNSATITLSDAKAAAGA